MKIRSFNLDNESLKTLEILGHSQHFKNESAVVRHGLKLVRSRYGIKLGPKDALSTTKKVSKKGLFTTADSTDLMRGFGHFLCGKMSSEDLEDYQRERAVEGRNYKAEDWFILRDRAEELEKLQEEFKTKHRG